MIDVVIVKKYPVYFTEQEDKCYKVRSIQTYQHLYDKLETKVNQ